MKKFSQKQLTSHIDLVKWEQQKKLEKFNLLTIHSLLLNGNSKFNELKQIIENFNQSIDKGVDRKHLQYQYVNRLYLMLSQLVAIPIYQNMQTFLNRIYQWTQQGGKTDFDFDDVNSSIGKSRPGTASTRTRPFSAYSRPKSGYPTLGMIKVQDPDTLRVKNRQKTNIDYDKLQPGDIQFYNGIRTIHPEEQNPRKKLKQYQRKIFYDQNPDSDIQILQLQKQGNDKQFRYYKPPVMKVEQVEILPSQPVIQFDQNGNPIVPNQGQVPAQEQNDANQLDAAEDDVNVDDLPLQGEEQPQQVIEKLKPRHKAYIKHETQLSKNRVNYQGGIQRGLQQRNKMVRKKQQDEWFKDKMSQWAKQKSRVQKQQRRRAESARIGTRPVGIMKVQQQKLEQNVNFINLQKYPIAETKTLRPKTAFRSFNPVNRDLLIKNCFMTGKLDNHIIKPQYNPDQQRFMRITSVAQKPKKKTFEQILREAESKVQQQQLSEITHVKQKFAKNKVAFQTNRIMKSITHHANQQYEYEDEFVGQITGLGMLANPFFKVGKKKKKKKKKK